MKNRQRDIIIELLQKVITSKIDLITFIEQKMFEYINMEDCDLKYSITKLCEALDAYFIEFGDNENVSTKSLASTVEVFDIIENTLTILKCS